MDHADRLVRSGAADATRTVAGDGVRRRPPAVPRRGDAGDGLVRRGVGPGFHDCDCRRHDFLPMPRTRAGTCPDQVDAARRRCRRHRAHEVEEDARPLALLSQRGDAAVVAELLMAHVGGAGRSVRVMLSTTTSAHRLASSPRLKFDLQAAGQQVNQQRGAWSARR